MDVLQHEQAREVGSSNTYMHVLQQQDASWMLLQHTPHECIATRASERSGQLQYIHEFIATAGYLMNVLQLHSPTPLAMGWLRLVGSLKL